MSYRICYEEKKFRFPWIAAALLIAGAQIAGEGVYDALARYVGAMIRAAF